MQNEKNTNEIDETSDWEEYEKNAFRFGKNSKKSILCLFIFLGIGILPSLYFALKAIIKDKDRTGYFGLFFFFFFSFSYLLF